jgi:hypothetical protein
MQANRTLLALVACAALAATGTAARAETNDDMSFSGMFKADRIDTNKDTMVSKAEFLAQMGRVWDMKTKEMKIKGDRITMQQLQEILMYMRAGG